jgi:hypothetical protein
VAMRYSAVVNYVGAVEIPLLPLHPVSSSSSASTAASQPTPATFADSDTAAPTGAGPAHLRAAAVCSQGVGTFSRPYFQLIHVIIVCF